MADALVDTSKFLSFVLRHRPDSIDLELDREGWADVATLITCAAQHGRALDRTMVEAVVATSNKKRFTLSPDRSRIRAAQGHSMASVAVSHIKMQPPTVLYHGTATRFLASINDQGLLHGSRHHVHLSADIETAITIGSRHGKPAVLRVDAERMHALGYSFFLSDNAVWLVEHVPVTFLASVQLEK